MGSVNLSPVDIPENSFEAENNIAFDPSKLDFSCQEKKVMSTVVAKMLKKYNIYLPTIWLLMQMD